MKTPFFTFDLSERVAIYVPSTTEVNKATDNRKQTEKVITEFCRMYGGATATDAVGGWLSKSAGLVTEKVTIVYANCTKKARRANMRKLVDLANNLKREMHQEAVTIEVNNKLAFI